MKKVKMKELLEIAIEASVKAGIEILKIYRSDDFEISFKADNSPLTRADSESNLLILSMLNKTGFPVLSEENKEITFDQRKDWESLWIVDPLDGTKEFIKRNGEFTVNIALVENKQAVLGVIYTPVTRELYFAEKDKGSYKAIIDKDYSVKDIFSSSQKLPFNNNKHYTLVVSRSHMNDKTESFVRKTEKEKGKINIASRGSSLKMCMVAEGSADCYPRFAPTMEWDTAAGHAIAKYAGKSVTNIETGEELIYNKESLVNPGFIVQ
ncbi:MAG: 3'(2'),5'-bisphosphate nucleotidase CysQ [Bacteroidales bacterium]